MITSTLSSDSLRKLKLKANVSDTLQISTYLQETYLDSEQVSSAISDYVDEYQLKDTEGKKIKNKLSDCQMIKLHASMENTTDTIDFYVLSVLD